MAFPMTAAGFAVFALAASAAPAGDNSEVCQGDTCARAEGVAPGPARDSSLLQIQADRMHAQVQPSTHGCNFMVRPGIPYYWDAQCSHGMSGCFADGASVQCRFCGAGVYRSIACPGNATIPVEVVGACAFEVPPEIPYYWDDSCEHGILGCFADGVHTKCRFCGQGAYAGTPCPTGAAEPGPSDGTEPEGEACNFSLKPTIPYYWAPDCNHGIVGCFADGRNVRCRFCGAGAYADIECPADATNSTGACTFVLEPTIPYVWDESCAHGKKGCFADGVHPECRFCGGGAYGDIACS